MDLTVELMSKFIFEHFYIRIRSANLCCTAPGCATKDFFFFFKAMAKICKWLQVFKSKAELQWWLLRWDEHQREENYLFIKKVHFFFTWAGQNFTFSKQVAPPWDPKENCATLWGETRTQLEEKWLLHSLNECHSASLLLLQLSAQAGARDICVFRLSICPSASCLRMLHLHRRFRCSCFVNATSERCKKSQVPGKSNYN